MRLEPILTHFFPGPSFRWSLKEASDDTGANYATLSWFGPGEKPTQASLEALAATLPSEAARQTQRDRADAKARLQSDEPLARAIRALLRITKPVAITLAAWRQQFIDAIDADV